MNWNCMEGDDWKQVRTSLKVRWGKLTNEDLERIAGNREQLLVRLRALYGLTEQRAEAQLKDWERHQEPIEPSWPTN